MRLGQRILLSAALGMLLASSEAVLAADPEIDKLVQGPVGKDWVTNGGNLTNQRYSTLKQIDTSNVKQLKGAWMTRLKGSGFGGKYSFEATPLVKDGVMYIVTGNDDVFALNAKTGEFLWERWSGVDQKITSVCCGWDSIELGTVHSAVQHGAGSGRNSVDVGSHGSLLRVRRQPVEPHADTRVISGG